MRRRVWILLIVVIGWTFFVFSDYYMGMRVFSDDRVEAWIAILTLIYDIIIVPYMIWAWQKSK